MPSTVAFSAAALSSTILATILATMLFSVTSLTMAISSATSPAMPAFSTKATAAMSSPILS